MNGRQRQALIIVNAMFTWLVSTGYLRGNPMALLRQRAKQPAPRVTRYLSLPLWDEVKRWVEQLPRETEAERRYHARCRWLTTLFYLQGMRISEVAGGRIGDFFRRLGADGQDQWWLETLGKGEKTRIVPASPELIAELRRYRTANGRLAPGRRRRVPAHDSRQSRSRIAQHDQPLPACRRRHASSRDGQSPPHELEWRRRGIRIVRYRLAARAAAEYRRVSGLLFLIRILIER